MNGFLLDINVISEFRKGDRADPKVLGWIEVNAAKELWLSVVVLGELQRGTNLVERRDPIQAELLQQWLDQLIEDYDDRMLPITRAIALRWGSLGIPDPIPVLDGLIAATALEHNLTVVTRNVGDFVRSGVAVVNPFD